MEQIHIGKVTASEAIVQEIQETEDFQTFCMGCVRRHRNGDWGEIRSEYVIPRIFCLGYAERITVTTNEDRTETEIEFLETDI